MTSPLEIVGHVYKYIHTQHTGVLYNYSINYKMENKDFKFFLTEDTPRRRQKTTCSRAQGRLSFIFESAWKVCLRLHHRSKVCAVWRE